LWRRGSSSGARDAVAPGTGVARNHSIGGCFIQFIDNYADNPIAALGIDLFGDFQLQSHSPGDDFRSGSKLVVFLEVSINLPRELRGATMSAANRLPFLIHIAAESRQLEGEIQVPLAGCDPVRFRDAEQRAVRGYQTTFYALSSPSDWANAVNLLWSVGGQDFGSCAGHGFWNVARSRILEDGQGTKF
jgi:hypothetical protein